MEKSYSNSYKEAGVDVTAGYESVELREALKSALKTLDEDERAIITMRFLQEKTQSEVGAALGLTQMYVSRKERKILEKLRSQFNAG